MIHRLGFMASFYSEQLVGVYDYSSPWKKKQTVTKKTKNVDFRCRELPLMLSNFRCPAAPPALLSGLHLTFNYSAFALTCSVPPDYEGKEAIAANVASGFILQDKEGCTPHTGGLERRLSP